MAKKKQNTTKTSSITKVQQPVAQSRVGMGKEELEVFFPGTPSINEMSLTYETFLRDIKRYVADTRTRIIIHANTQMICLYWQIGNSILQHQQELGWGAKVADRMSRDLRKEFPDMKGFSPRNLKYMRQFAQEWPDFQIVQRVVAQLPWRSNLILLGKLTTLTDRLWYAHKALQYGWSSTIMDLQIESGAHKRSGQEVNNFDVALPPYDSDMVRHIFKDPYLFDFLGTDMPRRELDIEKKLTEHIVQFLLELGQGFAFVGRQVHLELGGDDFYIDMLFYHLQLRCYVVVELKACEFDPGFVSKLNMYQNVVNHVLNHPGDNPAIGLLLVKGKNKTVVEYSLEGFRNPIGVADWQNQLTDVLPEDLRSSLPTVEEIERSLPEDDMSS